MTTKTETQDLTEEQLLKSLEELEGKKPPEAATPDPKVKVMELTKNTRDTIDEEASEGLQKALDVSEELSEFANLIGLHIDQSLETLQKSIKTAAERDLSFFNLLKGLKDEVKALGEKIDQFGKAPAPKDTTVTQNDVLKKGADGGPIDDQAKNSLLRRRQVLTGLEELVKSAGGDPAARQRYLNTTAAFEATGKISDGDLHRALLAYNGLQKSNGLSAN